MFYSNRVAAFFAALIVGIVFVSTPAIAQDWTEYINRDDGFRVDFPGQPTIAHTTFTSEYGVELPARVYTAMRESERYSLTVADYRNIEKLAADRAAKTCPTTETGAVADERACGLVVAGRGYWRFELAGALLHAAYSFIRRDAKITHLAWAWQDLVEGIELQLTNNADQSRTFAFISMHKNRLYVLEGTVQANSPPPGLFQQSMGYVDTDARAVRYQTIYSNKHAEWPRDFPAPPQRNTPQAPLSDESGYVSREDGFRVVFPRQPAVTQTTFKTEYGVDLPARVHSVTGGFDRYSVTVVDYRDIQRLADERAKKTCPTSFGDERACGLANAGRGYWKEELGGAMLHAAYGFIMRDAKVTHMAWAWQDLVEGIELQLTNNADQSRTFVHISMHRNRLYIIEGTVPGNYPPPGLFQQSVGYVDEQGRGVRYQTIYSNLYAEWPKDFPAQPMRTGR